MRSPPFPIFPIAATAAGLLSLSLLAGCSGISLQDRAQGWRGADVVALGHAGELAPGVDHDCAFRAAPDAQYLVVRYRDHGIQTRSLGTPAVPPGVRLEAGEAVQVNIQDCSVRVPAS